VLVLTRKPGENIRIGEDIIVSIVGIEERRIKIGISAPPNVEVDRDEVVKRKRAGRRILIRFLRTIGAAPEIQGDQGKSSGPHRVRLIPDAVDHACGRLFKPTVIPALPDRPAGEWRIDFLCFVPVARVRHVESQQQLPAGQMFARDGTSGTDAFSPTVYLKRINYLESKRLRIPDDRWNGAVAHERPPRDYSPPPTLCSSGLRRAYLSV
jgi:carbon storage regulator CsrA